jgi:transposase-like protein
MLRERAGRCASGCARAKLTSIHVLGTTTDESAELKRLPRENAELRRVKAILKTASIVSSFDQKVALYS